MKSITAPREELRTSMSNEVRTLSLSREMTLTLPAHFETPVKVSSPSETEADMPPAVVVARRLFSVAFEGVADTGMTAVSPT